MVNGVKCSREIKEAETGYMLVSGGGDKMVVYRARRAVSVE